MVGLLLRVHALIPGAKESASAARGAGQPHPASCLMPRSSSCWARREAHRSRSPRHPSGWYQQLSSSDQMKPKSSITTLASDCLPAPSTRICASSCSTRMTPAGPAGSVAGTPAPGRVAGTAGWVSGASPVPAWRPGLAGSAAGPMVMPGWQPADAVAPSRVLPCGVEVPEALGRRCADQRWAVNSSPGVRVRMPRSCLPNVYLWGQSGAAHGTYWSVREHATKA
jgi:hypothetical protein